MKFFFINIKSYLSNNQVRRSEFSKKGWELDWLNIFWYVRVVRKGVFGEMLGEKSAHELAQVLFISQNLILM